ncbi:MAG TPA: bifunctional DNA-formamidopyrimidine glycosylase/DNA-(apurinic or apyrimidinic site) lyase, partial [Myxococcales bacterium]|nr:bifunctional DNA-formamidopyrimidine glycosylase/DNA-(apurinic or apyrimidinic site) lyase [Myxococcales bacterium]
EIQSLDELSVLGSGRELQGRHFVTWERRGKNLLGFGSGRIGLLSHLGMTGKWVADAPSERPHQRLVLVFQDQQLPERVSLVDSRRFGRSEFISNEGLKTHPRIADLGIEPLGNDLNGRYLERKLERSRAPWKQKLLEQNVVAGLGNIALCEIGWRSRIHPHVPCSQLSSKEWDDLARCTQEHLRYVLKAEDGEEIAYLGEKNAENPFLCYGRQGEPCPNCNSAFQRVVLSGRPTFFCGSCQPLES